jgi:hypothetical protein
MVLIWIGFLFGVLGALMHDAGTRWKLIFMREYLGMPAAIWIGYRLIGSLHDARKFPYMMVVAGIITATMLMVAFNQGAEEYELHKNMNALRTISFVSSYAGVGCAVLVFSVQSGARLFRTWVALAIAGYCFCGQLAPLHRADWAGIAAALAVLPLCAPPGARLKNAFHLGVVTISLALSLWIGLHLASVVTGRNFHKTFEDRVLSMLPGETYKKSDVKAWATRIPAIQLELQMWSQNPIMGRGFAYEESTGRNAEVGAGFHHNAWVSTLTQTGVFGFAGVGMAVLCPFFVGLRMIRANTDRVSTLIGGLGVMVSAQQATIGMAAPGFGGYRMAMLMGLVTGVVFRVREIQLTRMRVAAEYEAGRAYGEYGYDENGYGGLPEFAGHDIGEYGQPQGQPHPNLGGYYS